MDCQENEVLVAKVYEIYHKISRLENLNPSDRVNTLFTQLVLTCMSPSHIDVTKLSKRVQDMRCRLIKLCGKAEGLLESHFSTLIGSQQNPLHHISLFPYYTNYLKLSHLEFTMLSKQYYTGQVPTKIAFLGSGPLPLTSIILASQYLRTTTFHNYDIDPLANYKARQLVSPDPDLSRRMAFHTLDVMDLSSQALKEYEVVFLAALVGMEKEEKAQVIDHLSLHMAPGTFLLLRSSHGARAFLYPVVGPHELQGFEVISVFHPTDEVINSVIVARKCPRAVFSLNSTVSTSRCSEIRGFKSLNQVNMIEESTIDEKLS